MKYEARWCLTYWCLGGPWDEEWCHTIDLYRVTLGIPSIYA